MTPKALKIGASVAVVVLALTGLLATLGIIAPLEPFAFWLAFVAWMLVAVGCLAELA